MGGTNRSLLIINKSSEAHLKLKLYVSCDPVCFMPLTTKEIKPNDKFFYTSEWGCKLELAAVFKDKKQPKKLLLKPQQWVGRKYVRITESLDVIEDDLANYPEEEKKGRQKMNRDNELEFTDGKRNFYSILGLDMGEVRAMSKDEQDEEIATAFLRQIQIWHSNFNEDGDDEIAREVIMAYDVLQDREKRARYNNLADYDKGWLSGKRFKAVFWPECETVAQRLTWLKRMGLLALSAGLTIGGIVSIVLTAGFSSPLVLCAVAGGLHSLRQTVRKEAVVDGCDVEKWLMSTGVGYLLAFLPGGAAIATAVLQTAAISVAELTAIRMAISAGCAIVSSLGTDAKKRFIDGEKITVKQALGHAACQCAAAVAATLAGGAVAKAMLKHSPDTTPSTADLESLVQETGERASSHPAKLQQAVGEVGVKSSSMPTNLTGAVNEIGMHDSSVTEQARRLFQRIPAPLSEEVTRAAIEKVGEFAEKHSNDSQFPDKITSLPDQVAIQKAVEVLVASKKISSEDNNLVGLEKSEKLVETHGIFKRQNKTKHRVLRYKSNGWWYNGLSKMVVSYILNGSRRSEEVRGNYKIIIIPLLAKSIEVHFEVWRPSWGFVLKYDRFERCWCKPSEPHVFHYPTPVTRTFTIDGTLWREAVIRVTDEHHNETKEL